MNKLANLALVSGLSYTSVLALPAAATTIPVQQPCDVRPIISIVRPLLGAEIPQDVPPPETQSQRVRRILKDSYPKRCVWQDLQHDGKAEADLESLKEIMLNDPDSNMRRDAAEAFAEISFAPKALLAALTEDLDKETDAYALELRMTAIGNQLMGLSAPDWDDSIDVGKLMLSLEFSLAGRSANEIESAYKDRAFLLARLIWRMSSIAGSEDSPAKPRVTKELWALVNDLFLHDLALAERGEHAYAEWVKYPLGAFAEALELKAVDLDPAQQLSLFAALGKAMDAPDQEMRKISIGAMARLDAAYLSPSEAGQLLAATVSAAHDPEPEIRERAVALLGNLTRARATDGAELVAALHDSSELVRIAAARSMLCLQAVPAAAVPALIAMTKRDKDETVAAMEVLSREGSTDAMQALIDVLDRPEFDSDDEYRGPTPVATAIQEIAKRGSKEALPLLARVRTAKEEGAQGHLYAALLNAGWPSVAMEPSVVEQTLAPAIGGENEEARRFALSLLAMRPLEDKHRYASTMIDGLVERYLRDKPQRTKRGKAISSEFGLSPAYGGNPYWNNTWPIDPRLAVSLLAGRSDSQFAAQRMVSWVCARHRLELAVVGKGYLTFGGSPLETEAEISKTMAASLNRMGEIARPYIDSALVEKKRTVLCQRYLGPKNPA